MIQDPLAVQPLIEAMLHGGGSSVVQCQAAKSLGSIGDPQAIPPLIHALRSRPFGRLPATAASVLGDIGATSAIDPLADVLCGRVTARIRFAAAQALGGMRDARAVGCLVRHLHNHPVQVRVAAAAGLGKSGDARATQALIEALENDPETKVQSAAALALRSSLDDRAVPALIRVLKNQRCPLRVLRAVIGSLGSLQDSSAVDPLIAMLSHKKTYIACAAARALGNIRGQRSVDALTQASASRNEALRICAREQLDDLRWRHSSGLFPDPPQ